MDTRDVLEQMAQQGNDPLYAIGTVVILLLALVIRYVQKARKPVAPPEDEEI